MWRLVGQPDSICFLLTHENVTDTYPKVKSNISMYGDYEGNSYDSFGTEMIYNGT